MNKSVQTTSHFLPAAIAACLLAASASQAAQERPVSLGFNEAPATLTSIRSQPSEIIVDTDQAGFGPTLEERLELYKLLVGMGLAQELPSPPESGVDGEYLTAVWHRAVEKGWVDPNSYTKMPIKPGQVSDTNNFFQPIEKASAACWAAAASFTAAALGVGVDCGALFLSDGALTPFEGGRCAAELIGTAASIWGMKESCKHRPRPVASSAAAGISVGSAQTMYCPDGFNVRGVTTRFKNGIVGRIIIHCTNGQDLVFGNMLPSTGSTTTRQNCGGKELLNGLAVRAGSHIDATRIRCVSPGSTQVRVGSWIGGSGGVQRVLTCPVHHHVKGATVFFEGDAVATESRLNSLVLHCR